MRHCDYPKIEPVIDELEKQLFGHHMINSQVCGMNRKLLFLAALAILFLPISVAHAKTIKIKGSVAVTKLNKKAAPVTRAQLANNPVYKEGLQLFQQKNYAGAMKCFYQLDSTGYCCDMVHYYIGQCYQNTNQTVAAQQHYDWVSSRSKDPTLRSYASYANQTIAYYSSHRTYSGQGNNFDHSIGGGGGGGGGRRMGFG